MNAKPTHAFVRIMHKHLPDELRPSYVMRHDEITVIFTDPCSTQVEVVAWMLENLTVAEHNYIRAAAGEPPVGEPLSEHALDGLARVPESLLIVDRRLREELDWGPDGGVPAGWLDE